MSKSTPKKRGRPATGRFSDRARSIRLSDDLVARIDRWAESEGVGRSEAFRRLVEQALATKGKR